MGGRGPAPKWDPVRHRGSRIGPTILPAAGRQGAAPRWPLPDPATPAERAAWRQMWATPHAVAWERLGWLRTLARFCVLLVAAEQRDAKVSLLAEVRQLEDRLGLTPTAMRSMLWQIGPADEVGGDGEDDLARRRRLAARMRAVDETPKGS